jgi:membrane-associated phospholipid phosphatase
MGAAACIVLLVLTWVITRHVSRFQDLDRSILVGFVGLHNRGQVPRVAHFIAGLCNPSPYVYLAAVPVLVALIRRRPRILLAIGAILLGANVTTQLVKPILPAMATEFLPGGVTMNGPTWPSGHATAAMSLTLCGVLAAPARLRPAVATLGAAFSVAVSYSFMTLAWHFPSDVLGGFLVAVTWTLMATAAVREADARWPRRRSDPSQRLSVLEVIAPQVALVAGVLVVAAIILLARPHEVIDYARGHHAFLIGATAIGVLALALASAVTWAVTGGSGRAPTAAPRRRWRPGSG